jgi:hypothetical protein
MKYLSISVLLVVFSCANKETVALPKSDTTIVKTIEDHSPIYIFFRVNGKDTLADVNRKNSIISTNWVFNIDKRLPLRLIIPEVIKLQEKKRNEKAHQNEEAQNYYSYADSIGKNLAFLPFTKVFYKMEKPKRTEVIFFDKNNQIWVNNLMIKKDKLKNCLEELANKNTTNYSFSFSADLSYECYVQDKIFLLNSNIKSQAYEEYIY